MLRITEEASNGSTARLRLEGSVVGPYVFEVRRSCEQLLSSGRQLILDLAEVSFVDRDGITLFRELSHRQVTLAHCSPFVTEQLRENQL